MKREAILQLYIEEARVRMHGACARVAKRIGIPAWKLRRYLHGVPQWVTLRHKLALQHAARTWRPILQPHYGAKLDRPLLTTKGEGEAHATVTGYLCALPNGHTISIQRREYVCGTLHDHWYVITWPPVIEHPLLHIPAYHEVGKLTEVRALIEEYVRTEYTIPKGAVLL